MIDGTIIKGIGGFYYINTEKGIYECRARGIFRKENITPVVGDYVQIEILDESNKKGSLEIIKERKNELIRPRVANIDQAVIVFAACSPDINLDLLDRFIILVEEQNMDIVICINKIDLDTNKNYEDICKIYSNAGYKIIPVCTIDKTGIDELKDNLENKITVFAGPSGVGKSSILNAVSPNLSLVTGEISSKIERGKHTTRHAELMQISHNSYIVDSPGFTSLRLDHIDKDYLQHYFREFEKFNYGCRFNGCTHIHEPDCNIKARLGNEISEIRYKRYVSLYNELKEKRK